MAFDTHLVAVAWRNGRYDVVAQITADVDTAALQLDGLLHNVSADAGYLDEAAIVQKAAFAKYLQKETNAGQADAKAWYGTLPEETMFILVHRAEWESGLGG